LGQESFRGCGRSVFAGWETEVAAVPGGLTAFTRGQLSIPEHKPLIRELRLLERRVSRSGKDSVDHPIGGRDDHANVLFGAIVLLSEAVTSLNVSRETAAKFGEAMADLGRRSRMGQLRNFGRPNVTPVSWNWSIFQKDFGTWIWTSKRPAGNGRRSR
jgi:hypothetical protein